MCPIGSTGRIGRKRDGNATLTCCNALYIESKDLDESFYIVEINGRNC